VAEVVVDELVETVPAETEPVGVNLMAEESPSDPASLSFAEI
jgi:hypothetical protein